MSILLLLVLASLALALSALFGFIWAVKTGQFEDTCTPSMRLLMDESIHITPRRAGHEHRDASASAAEDHSEL